MKFALSLLLLAASARADDAAFFESKIRPVLVRHCYECHSAESGESKGGLLLDSRAGIRSGGDSGPAVVPGNPAKSLLLSAIRHDSPDLEMPPKGPRLPDRVIADFSTWIQSGAPDPRETSSAAAAPRPPLDLASARQFWAYKRPVSSGGSIDSYIRATLREHGLSPAPPASPRVLLRRLYFDLIGLPPSPQSADAFVRDASSHPAAYEQIVDALLASPRFGERWGRHWLDVVRYAESNGRESNLAFHHAWRYRDYVIDAVNEDLPFDRFLTEQIAGDLLPAADDASRARLLIATGFLAIGPKGLNEQNKAQFAADVADEQLDAVARAVMASSVACARCHDHKSEPFSMEDYYALAGIFKSTRTFYGNWIDSENNNHGRLIRLPDLPGQLIPNKPLPPQRVRQLRDDLARMDREEKEERELAARAKAEGRELKIDYFKALQKAIGRYWSRGGIEGQLDRVDENGRALPLCMGVRDGTIHDSPLYERGEIARPRQPVPRGFPAVFSIPGVPSPPPGQSGRLELARWLTSRHHPLTARVMANRVWRHLFGAGLVRTVDTFGFSGEPPTHPALLDHLARANPRRLDAEVIRDSMLAVSGLLDTARRPGSLVATLDGQSVSLIGFNTRLPPDLDGSRHRSIYLPVLRDHLPDVLEQFDMANPNLVTGDRDVTNVPLQALYLLNGPFVQDQARALAQRVARHSPDLSTQIRRAFQLCFNRLPDPSELQLATSFFQKAPGSPASLLPAFCQALLSSAEFRFAD